MRSLLNDISVIYDQDQVGIAYRWKPVGNDKRGSPCHDFLHCVLEHPFQTGIDC